MIGASESERGPVCELRKRVSLKNMTFRLFFAEFRLFFHVIVRVLSYSFDGMQLMQRMRPEECGIARMRHRNPYRQLWHNLANDALQTQADDQKARGFIQPHEGSP